MADCPCCQLTPRASAGQALRLMNADDLPTRWTPPALLLGFKEMPYPGLAYALEVVNHAHAVLGSVAFVQAVQGKLSQPKQYLAPPLAILSQVLIRQKTRVFGLPASSPRQPGHGFFSLIKARQSPQSIPHGAISFARKGLVLVALFGVMSPLYPVVHWFLNLL